MKSLISALMAGIVMGLGLGISQMINPAKVIAFLDIFGNWDPSLGLVMAGALLVTVISFRGILKCSKPLCGGEFSVPSKKEIDQKLIIGAALFGAGWGLAGFCPAPAVASLAFGLPKSFIFVGSMLAGMVLYRVVFTKS